MTALTTEERLQNLQTRIDEIEQRNARVEAEKAWEVSSARIGTICLITYLVAAAVLWLLGTERFWLNAMLPVCGFYLSSQSLPVIKRRWLSAQGLPRLTTKKDG
jgi:hypothetical protein